MRMFHIPCLCLIRGTPKQITFKIHEKPLSVFHGVEHFNWNENERPLVVLLALDFRCMFLFLSESFWLSAI